MTEPNANDSLDTRHTEPAEAGPVDNWERSLTELLADLTATQTDLLEVLEQKRQMLLDDNRAGLAELQPREEDLCEQLKQCQQRRQALLGAAAESGLPDRDLRTLASALPTAARTNLAPQVREARARARMLQHQSLTTWVLAQRRLLHLSQMIEILATGGRRPPTYDKKGSSTPGGVLVDRAV